MSRVIIPAPHCQRCSDSDMRLRRIERHTKDQVTYCWRCERCDAGDPAVSLRLRFQDN